jgi:hypothetical protein
MYRRGERALALAVGCLVLGGGLWADTSPAFDAKAAFEQMKSLAGTWEGTVPATAGQPAMPVQVRYAVTSGGKAVAETLFAGTPHEMLSVYTLAGDDLTLTHYCSSGNHPLMKLDRAKSKAGDLQFEFSSALNFDPAKADHIHGAHFTLQGNQLGHTWSHWANGKPSPDELQVTFTRTDG